jgi:predicted N-acetyltransferase YhbS
MLGPVAVRPEDQNQGAGSAAIRAALAAAQELGENHVVVVGHPAYYPRFGFVRASTQGIGLAVEVPDEAAMALTMNANNPLPSGLVHFAKPFGI